MGDDWVDKDLAEESYDEICQKCKMENQVTVLIGPPHGGWAEDYTPQCGNCGSPLSTGKAFQLVGVKLKSKR